MVLSVLISSLAGFALSKMRFKTKTVLFEVNNAALMFVPIAVTIPRYLTIDLLGITDTYFAHILPLLAMPIGLFLIKQFIDQVPDSLIEAAFIDGASDFMIYRRIVVPLVKPALATAAILAFQAAWNNIETSALFINNESLRTLAFYMNTFASQTNIVVGQGMAAAGALIMFLPNLILFIILQSNVMNTMAYSGLK
jgi:ABC-type glycerol-3-phosphate transport system permease component